MAARRRYRPLTCALCAALAAAAALWAAAPTSADGPLLDLLVAARAAVFPVRDPPERAPVAVVAVDRRSLAEPELAPYPRAFFAPVWAALLDGVLDAGARAVAFDLLLSYSANRFAPDFDAPFLAALDRHRDRVVLARSTTTLPALPFLAALRNDEAALGLVELSPDPDGRYRRVPATHATVDGPPAPSLVRAVLARAGAPAMAGDVVLAPRRHPETLPTYALVDVLRCRTAAPQVLRSAFAGKIVLIGTTLPEEDRRASSTRFLPAPRADGPRLHPCGLRRLGASLPGASSVPGVFLHAAALDAVLRGQVTVATPPAGVAIVAGAAAALGAVLGLALTPWSTVGAILLASGLLFGGATALLATDRWLPLAWPLGSLGAAAVVAYVVRYVVEESTRRRIEHAFGRYLAPAVVDRLASDPGALRLGGERREVTVMFADLSGFTALSGRMEPEVLTRTTNRYLGLIAEQVEATGGYVDKFIGDAVMAVWGAPADDPRHAANALRAALGAVARVGEERAQAEARGEIGFSVKIGVNSGPAVVGNVGTDRRYNYTVVGETVNVAARLEGVPDLYGCQIAVGPRTAELAGDEFLLRELDAIRVKGREEPLAVLEPVAEHGRATPVAVEGAGRYAEALAAYRARRFTDAAALWEALAKGPSPDGPAARMAGRARAFAGEPPPATWDGVWVLSHK